MITLSHDRQIEISTGNSRYSNDWKKENILVSALWEKLKKPQRGKETLSQFFEMPKMRQDDLKDVGGFVGGTFTGNRRLSNDVTGHDLVTLDFDDIPGGITDDVLNRVEHLQIAAAVYSTRKHTDKAPRLRILFPINRTCTPEEYEPLARWMAGEIGIEMADPTTFDQNRLMFWPSCCADSDYIFKFWDYPLLDVDDVLSNYKDWKDATEWPGVDPETPAGNKTYKRGEKLADPKQKGGLIGAFCQMYNVHDAIRKWLKDKYRQDPRRPDRYTYTKGSTFNGGVVYGDGDFFYSNHATDPAGHILVNSFDLIRLHSKAHLEEDPLIDPGTPPEEYPSFVKMIEWIKKDHPEVVEVAFKSKDKPLPVVCDDGKARQLQTYTPKPSIDASELQKMELPPVSFLVDDVLTPGLGVIASPPKTYKTFMMLDLVCSVCTGRPFLGLNTHKYQCLYYDLESGKRRPRDRINKIMGDELLPPGSLQVITLEEKPGRLDTTFMQDLEYRVKETPGLKLIVIDVFQKIRGARKRNQNAYEGDYAELEQLQEFATKNDICIMLVTHTTKSKRDDPFENITGSNGILGSADCAWTIERDRKSNKAILHITGRDIPSNDFAIHFDTTSFKWEMLGEAEDVRQQMEDLERQTKYHFSAIPLTIVKLVQQNGGKWSGTVSDIKAASGFLCSKKPITEDVKRIGNFINGYADLLYIQDNIKFIYDKTNTKRNYTFFDVTDVTEDFDVTDVTEDFDVTDVTDVTH